jgi:dipeptidyl-peptidase 4
MMRIRGNKPAPVSGSRRLRAWLWCAIALAPVICAGEPPPLATLVSKELQPKTFGPSRWLDGGRAYATLEAPPGADGEAREIVAYDSASGARRVLVDLRALTPAQAAKPLMVDDYEWSRDGRRVLLYTDSQKVWREHTRGDYWLLDLDAARLTRLGGGASPGTLMFASFSPDGRRVAYLRRDAGAQSVATNLYVEDAASGAITALTRDAEVRGADGSGRTIINGTGDWVNEEEFDLRKGYAWSPDGARIAYWQFDATAVQDFLLINNTDTPYPVTTAIPYPLAGSTNSTVRVGIVAAGGGPTRWLALGPGADGYVPRMAWTPDGRELCLERFDRLQQHLEVLAAAADGGALRTILSESSSTWIDLVDQFTWLGHGTALLWASEQDGWRHLYAVPRKGGRPRLLTAGAYDVTGEVGYVAQEGLVYFMAARDDPARRELYSVHADGRGGIRRVTPRGAGPTHTYDLAPDGHYALHTVSGIDQPPRTDLVRLPGHAAVRVLEDNRALVAATAALLATPTEFFRIGLAGGLKVDGWMLHPPGFDPARRYPVLVYVYDEPAGQTVLDRWAGKRQLFLRRLAAQGYVIVSMDTRGTPAPKGAAWRHVVYGAIGELASAEQADALRALAAQRPYLDLERVAVWGWSGGGSMTLNLMFRHPELYRVGMSVASVSDQRYYDTIYQERYMGTPQGNPDGYRRGSPINFVQGLAGSLLLVSGSGDDNVHFQMTQMLLNRLIELGKPVDFMEYPNRSHAIDEGEGTSLHLYSLLERYLKTHLPAGDAPLTAAP